MTRLAKAAGIAGILILASTAAAWRPQAAEPPGALGEGKAAALSLLDAVRPTIESENVPKVVHDAKAFYLAADRLGIRPRDVEDGDRERRADA